MSKNVQELNIKAKSLRDEVWKDTSLWQSNFCKAVNLLHEALDIDPENVVSLTNLGAALCDSGEYEKAVSVLSKAIELGSTDGNTYFNMAVACINSNKEYMAFFNKAREMNKCSATWEVYFDPQAH